MVGEDSPVRSGHLTENGVRHRFLSREAKGQMCADLSTGRAQGRIVRTRASPDESRYPPSTGSLVADRHVIRPTARDGARDGCAAVSDTDFRQGRAVPMWCQLV